MEDCIKNSVEEISTDSPYLLFLKAASLLPISHYFLGLTFILLVFLYNFLEIHFFNDFFTAFRGQSVSLSFNSSSQIYQQVVSKCQILHGRYLSTPWLSSPHLQTAFLSFFGRPPVFRYRRQLFHTTDGGTIALDWLMNFDVMEVGFQVNDEVRREDKNPIMIVVPGLTSDSESAYIKHLAFKMAKRGWNVVVSNHRGLGGISITSDCFYNAGWTEDLRKVTDHLHSQYPEAPLFAVGTSIGANILVKYLGEDGVNIPIAGAAAICSPWDLLICDRFINRRLVQKFYDRVLTIGLKGYALLHQPIVSRLADWEDIQKSRSVRDFDNYATRVFGKYESVDTYYRRCSSANFVGNVAVPLLCISSIDDPVCTREAIPWDECRANENIVIATTEHGGHLAYFEGLTAKSVWWVRAVDEYFGILQSSPLIHRKKEMQILSSTSPLESSIDHAPYLNVTEDGLVTAVADEPTINPHIVQNEHHMVPSNEEDEDKHKTVGRASLTDGTPWPSERDMNSSIMGPVRKCIDQLSRQSRKTIWMLAYIAIVTTWPLVGPALLLFFKKKFRNVLRISEKR
ncbi:hypothetical protein LguiB_006713 [Lonicera macranthoides]